MHSQTVGCELTVLAEFPCFVLDKRAGQSSLVGTGIKVSGSSGVTAVIPDLLLYLFL